MQIPTFSAIVAAISDLDNAFAIDSFYFTNAMAAFKPLTAVVKRENRVFLRFFNISYIRLSLHLWAGCRNSAKVLDKLPTANRSWRFTPHLDALENCRRSKFLDKIDHWSMIQ